MVLACLDVLQFGFLTSGGNHQQGCAADGTVKMCIRDRPDNGTFKIGDTRTEGEALHFKGLPSFSPEMFKYIEKILNNLVHSLGNVVHDDTLMAPRHLNAQKNGLAKFYYIVGNPPFNMDFSDNRDTLAGEKHKERFFAGVPNIPNKDKDKMAVYLMFIQHIIYSMKEHGKAAIVVPTGFLTAGSGIPKKIREHIVKNRDVYKRQGLHRVSPKRRAPIFDILRAPRLSSGEPLASQGRELRGKNSWGSFLRRECITSVTVGRLRLQIRATCSWVKDGMPYLRQ